MMAEKRAGDAASHDHPRASGGRPCGGAPRMAGAADRARAARSRGVAGGQ